MILAKKTDKDMNKIRLKITLGNVLRKRKSDNNNISKKNHTQITLAMVDSASHSHCFVPVSFLSYHDS